MKQIFLIKADASLVDLLQEISLIAKETLLKYNISLSQLQFARRTMYGYAFLKKKKVPVAILNEIAQKISDHSPHYPLAYIIETLSQLINITVYDAIALHGISLTKQHAPQEKAFLATQLLSISDSPQYIPRNPWFNPIGKITADTWEANDITTDTRCSIHKTRKANFYEYEVYQNYPRSI